MTNLIIPRVIMQGIPINHKRARIRQALLLSLIWVLASTRALLEKKKKKKKKKKIKKKLKKKLSSSLPSRKFLNYRKTLFLSKVILVFLPAPIYKVKYVRDHLGAGKHPSPLGNQKLIVLIIT